MAKPRPDKTLIQAIVPKYIKWSIQEIVDRGDGYESLSDFLRVAVVKLIAEEERKSERERVA